MYLNGAYNNYAEGRKEGLSNEQISVLAALRVLIKQKDFETNIRKIGDLIGMSRERLRPRIEELEERGFLRREGKNIVRVKPDPRSVCETQSGVCEAQQSVCETQKNVCETHSPLKNPPTNKINNKNINNKRESIEPDGGRSRAENKKEDFIVPSWSEVMDYARGRTNWRGSTQEMREEAADDYFAKMSECGWRVDGAPVVKWQAGVYRFYKQARKRYERESAARAATMFQAGYRPENRSYEHKVAMSERKKAEKAMEAAKAEAESQSDEERQATFDTIARIQARFAASENTINRGIERRNNAGHP